MNTKLSTTMNNEEVVMAMCEGNPGCIKAMCEMLNSNPKVARTNFFYLDSIGIYGSKIYMIWNDCCNRDLNKFFETLEAFKSGKFSCQEIHENLNKIRAEPFI